MSSISDNDQAPREAAEWVIQSGPREITPAERDPRLKGITREGVRVFEWTIVRGEESRKVFVWVRTEYAPMRAIETGGDWLVERVLSRDEPPKDIEIGSRVRYSGDGDY